jgi:hypothetical protein
MEKCVDVAINSKNTEKFALLALLEALKLKDVPTVDIPRKKARFVVAHVQQKLSEQNKR